ncbi:hypothetical protein C2E23DRAFT_518342 [Lenzites betulinus]|nr:hypothetical protein C2E23DRAFT_518342 [Lenzites betulinus]
MYKSSNFRKAQPQQDAAPTKYASQIRQLKEPFPNWTEQDLESVLVEVNGDTEAATVRILEGHAVQWDNVTRKTKKPTAPTSSYSKDPSAGRDRGDFRGGRGGGRGARGGAARGGARGVSARGGHHDVNGHRAKPSQSAEAPKDASLPESAPAPAVNGEATDVEADVGSAWHTSTPTTWGGDTAAINGATSHPTPAPAAASAPTPAHAPAPAPSTTKAGVTPATSKLSWAQIARKPQEKPAPPPAPAPAQPPVAPSAPAPPSPQTQQPEQVHPAEVAEPPSTSTGWEEPTTVQAPTWDDEPRPSQSAESVPAVEEAKPAQPEPKPVEEPTPERAAPAVLPVVPQQPAPESPAALPPKPLTPSIQARATPISHRTPKFKTTDQPVVLPPSAGSSVEKIGMQFGSLSLGGEDLDSHEPAPAEQKPVAPAAPEPASAPALPVQEPVAPIASPPSQTPLTSGSLFQSSLPQQQVPQQPQQPAQPPHVPTPAQPQQSTLSASLTQPALSAQTSLPASASTSAISPYSQQSQAISQQSLSSHQSQQPQPQSHLGYGQHGLAAHLEQVQAQQQQHVSPQPQQQQQTTQAQNLGGGPSSYFRQAEAPYFHAPTPPAVQNQDSPYGSFGQLGQQVQHQAQGSHLGNFGGAEYGYGESQRQQQQQQQQNFYDSYTGPTGFGNRSVLGHDDLKGLPGSQQPHGAPGLPPASAQSSQQHPASSQASSQGQPNAGQGPQQYPPPLPYYYPYPQNQFYGTPYNSGYTVPQPFVKYPTVFPGPPGPQSAPSPASKQGPSAVQPQSPYGQGLYAQQHPSNTYDDLGYQHHTQHAVGQNVNVGSGLPSSEYGKHQSLYGAGAGAQGMQGFMGLGQTAGPAAGQRATGGSPEAAYKPYGANVGVKDVGAGVGVGVGQGGVGQGPQGRGGVQQPGQGSFYAQRFAASQAGGPQGGQGGQPQGQGPQAHLGYPQGGSDGSTFYSYQPRQQQGYWQ